MLVINGQYNQAKVFLDDIDEGTVNQLKNLLNQPFVKGSKIRIMPDCHVGAGCTIGTTMTIKDTVVPNLVGVDIGCGMLTLVLKDLTIDVKQLDHYIKHNIPSGFKDNQHIIYNYNDKIRSLKCFNALKKDPSEFSKALGSLGGGNHFIEVNTDEKDHKYLVIHSGSRNLGYQVARTYQEKAVKYQQKRNPEIPKSLCFLEGQLKEDYLHDMQIIQNYAKINRQVIGKRISEEFLTLDFDSINTFVTVHNYIDLKSNILRKGAVSADAGEMLLIPLNMRDGSLICLGKGNADWNYSAPHGAGRLYSRKQAKRTFDLKTFKQSMEGIYSTSISNATLDECPMSYKDSEMIKISIQPTVKIVKQIKPIYNFKAK